MAKQSFEVPTAVDCPRSILQGESDSTVNPSDRIIVRASVFVSSTPSLTGDSGALAATVSKRALARLSRERRTHGPIERPPRPTRPMT
jgi:hypothetical protein